VNFREGGREFFTSFILAHFDKGEYKVEQNPGEFRISANIEKPMMNLITGKVEKKSVAFSFLHMDLEGRMLSKEQVAASTHFKTIYGKYAGGAQLKVGSIDIEGYAISVAHFAPHPYLLLLSEKFGYSSNKEFQENVIEYFRAHV
jgi:hypothetical protein